MPNFSNLSLEIRTKVYSFVDDRTLALTVRQVNQETRDYSKKHLQLKPVKVLVYCPCYSEDTVLLRARGKTSPSIYHLNEFVATKGSPTGNCGQFHGPVYQTLKADALPPHLHREEQVATNLPKETRVPVKRSFKQRIKDLFKI
jgi:hypothetical protein